MERFDVRRDMTTDVGWRLTPRDDGQGMFCYAEEAAAYRKSWLFVLAMNVTITIVCALIAAYLVVHKHGPSPLPTSQELNQLRGEKEALWDKLAAIDVEKKRLGIRLESAEFVIKRLELQVKQLRATTPSFPVIQEVIRHEAKTDDGLKKAVQRTFGPIKIEVRG